MAIGDLASVVDLRAGAILLGVAAAHFAVTAQMDAVRNYCGRICRHRVSNRLRTLHLPHPGGDGFRSLAAVSNAVRDRDTLSAFGRVRDRYPVHRRIVVAIVGTTDNPAAWRKKREKRDTAWKLRAGRREEISLCAPPGLE